MDFFKRHYEKIILVCLLVLFIFSMLYLLDAVDSSREITDADMRIPTKRPDYVVADPKSPEFKESEFMNSGNVWKPSVRRQEDAGDSYSDLLKMFPVARCGKCGKLIPLSIMEEEKACPLCHAKLRKPKNKFDPAAEMADYRRRQDDIDGDGIPNEVERRFGMNPDDPHDALQDLSGDGFTNIYLVKNNLAPDGSSGIPPLYHRFVLREIGKIELPLMLMKVNTNGSKDDREWDLQINDLKTDKVYRSRLVRKGERIKISGKYYDINKIDLKQSKVKKPADGSEMDVDESVVTLSGRAKDGSPEYITMQVGKKVYSPAVKAVLLDTGSGYVVTVDEGSVIRLRSKAGLETYVIKKIDPVTKEVFVTEGSGQKDCSKPITEAGFVPVKQRLFAEPLEK